MNSLYNFALCCASGIVRLFNGLHLTRMMPKESKLRKFLMGQQHILKQVRSCQISHKEHVVWVHASSLGEYSVVRPIMQHLRAKGAYIVLTFFSPTGYEALHANPSCVASHVFYLPLDTRPHAQAFLDAIDPEKVIFAVSEIWPNYLTLLHKRHIPTFLISAKITKRSSAMRWYGKLFCDALRSFTRIMVMDSVSERLLREKGIESNVVRTGDPLFDNALSVAQQDYNDPIIEQFTRDRRVFIAGSVHDANDISLVSSLIKAYPMERFIIVPHEVKVHFLERIKSSLEGSFIFYTQCKNQEVSHDVQVLVVDQLGSLASLYRYGAYVYVGGGFTNKLHSVIEPIVYSLPVAFGPRIHRKNTPHELISLGIGTKVETSHQLIEWFQSLKDNTPLLKDIANKAEAYVQKNCGSTNSIVKILDTLCDE